MSADNLSDLGARRREAAERAARLSIELDHRSRHEPARKESKRQDLRIGVAYVVGILHGIVAAVVLAGFLP